MRQSAQLVLFVSLTFSERLTRLIADNLKMYPTTFAHGSKACAVRLAFPAATFPMGIARSTTCERELIGFQSMVCGGRCRKRRSFETPETRLAKPSFGMSVFAVISRSAALSRPMPRERCATPFARGCGVLNRGAAFAFLVP